MSGLISGPHHTSFHGYRVILQRDFIQLPVYLNSRIAITIAHQVHLPALCPPQPPPLPGSPPHTDPALAIASCARVLHTRLHLLWGWPLKPKSLLLEA